MNALHVNSADLQSPSTHLAAPVPIPQAPQANPAESTATPTPNIATSWQHLSHGGVVRCDTGASSAGEDKPTAAVAAQLQGVGEPAAAGSAAVAEPPPAAQAVLVDQHAGPGSAAKGAEQPQGPSAQSDTDARGAPTPKPQRTLWHPHTGESLSGWKNAVSAAQDANEQAALEHGAARLLPIAFPYHNIF